MDDIGDIPRDDILDFSYLPKEHQFINDATFCRIWDYMVKRTQTREFFAKIVSCFRFKNQPGTFLSCHNRLTLRSGRFDVHELCRIVLPLWILAVLNPSEEKTLKIVNVTVAHFNGVSFLPGAPLKPRSEPSLIINTLIVVCDIDTMNQSRQKEMIETFLEDYYIECEYIHYVHFKDYDFFNQVNCIETTSHESPHIMFGSCCGIGWNVSQPRPVYGDRFSADRILIATLGYGYNKYPFLNTEDGNYRPIDIFEEYLAVPRPENSKSQKPNTFDYWLTSPWIIHDYTKTSEFIVCQTTDDAGFIVNGATARALNYLRKVWEEQKARYNNLVVLIPYGGQYMEDEMKAIYEATNEGIIIVCAAGREGGDVVFPAALGTVISVGVAGTGPKGKQIDVSIDFETRPAKLLSYYKKEVELPRDCGIAAARVTGLISLLLSRINSIMTNPGLYTENPITKMAIHIRDSKSDYLHTYVIRELIVNEGNGSHDPQLGYGDGEQIILSLLDMDPSFLIQKLTDIVCGEMNTQESHETEGDKITGKNEKFHGLNGENIHVGIIDQFKVAPHSTEPHPKDLHGNKCATVLHKISSKCQIRYLNTGPSLDVGPVVSLFEACTSEEYKTIDVISCSVGFSYFHLGLSTAVDNAVKAGKIIVFAAGNCGLNQQNSIFYPGRNGNIIVVGRGDRYYNRARYTSAGREIDFLAKTSQASSGTSFAAPVVAGYIALLLEFIKKEMESDKIEVWSGNEWKEIPISKAAQNVYAMRALLKLLVVKPQVHSETEGFGCLNFSVLFPNYDSVGLPQSVTKAFSTQLAKKKICQTLKKFYKREA